MPLTLLPLLDVQCLLEIEVSCTGRKRPALSPNGSFSSTSTACSSTLRRKAYRPTLTLEVLRMHAFGYSSRVSEVKKTLSTPEMRTYTAHSSRRLPDFAIANSSDHQRRSSLPSPPPRGTFCSATMSHCSSLAITDLDPSKQLHDLSSFHCDGPHPMQEHDLTAKREPLMSPDQWREKAEERLGRRELRRARMEFDESSGSGVQPLPLSIDCRPMEGSMAFPPSNSQLRISSTRSRSRSVAPLLMLAKSGQAQVLGEKELDAINMSLDRSKSMPELRETDNLEKQWVAFTVDDDDSTPA